MVIDMYCFGYVTLGGRCGVQEIFNSEVVGRSLLTWKSKIAGCKSLKVLERSKKSLFDASFLDREFQ